MSPITVIRWLLVIPLAGVGYLVAIGAAILASSLLTRACPASQVVSGVCTAPWFGYAEQAAFAVAAALGAGLWVALPVLVAPAHRHRVAGIALVSGIALATVFLWASRGDMFGAYLAAIAGGAAATRIARRADRADR